MLHLQQKSYEINVFFLTALKRSGPLTLHPLLALIWFCDTLLINILISFRANTKEIFLSDLENTKKNYRGENLRKKLFILRERLNDPEILSDDIIYNMLISFRDLQVIEILWNINIDHKQTATNILNLVRTMIQWSDSLKTYKLFQIR